MFEWVVIAFDNPTPNGFRTTLIKAPCAESAIAQANEACAIAVPSQTRSSARTSGAGLRRSATDRETTVSQSAEQDWLRACPQAPQERSHRAP